MTYFTYNYLEKKPLQLGLKEPVKVDLNKEYCLPELPPIDGTSFIQWLTMLNTAIEHQKTSKVDALHELFPSFFEAWSDFVQSAFISEVEEKENENK